MNQPKRKHNKTELPEGWKTIVARSFEEIEAVRPIWEQMQRNEPSPAPNADIDRYLSLVESMEGAAQPHVMVLYHGSNPEAMVIGRIERRRISFQIGYITVPTPSMRCLCITYGGILGQPEKEVCALLIRELMNILNRGEAKVVAFSHLRADSPIYQFAREIPGVVSRGYFPEIATHRRMSIPESIDVFYQSRSKRHRANLRRCIRKLESEYEGRVKMATYSDEGDVEQAIAVAAKVSAKTYQHGMGCGFVDDSRTQILLRKAAKLGWLRAYVLFVDEEPCAFQFMLRYGRTCFLDQIGFDPQWKKYNVGTVLFLYVLRILCSDSQVAHMDFYFGDADYKRSYGNEHWSEASAYIFAPRAYPILINTLRTSGIALNTGLKYVVSKLGLIGWVKQRWRNLLQAKNVRSKRQSPEVIRNHTHTG